MSAATVEVMRPPRYDLYRATAGGMTVGRSQGDTADNGMPVLRGHFAVFNRPTTIDSAIEGTFIEEIAPGAFTRTFSDRVSKLEEQFRASNYTTPESVVFCHEALGTPLDPSKLSAYARKALKAAGIDKPFRVWHGLRHTALTETAAAGVPAMFVQAKAGHAQGSTTERYLHANRTDYPHAAELAEQRLFAAPNREPTEGD